MNVHEIGIKKNVALFTPPKKNLIWGWYFKCPASEAFLNTFLSERVMAAFLLCLSAQIENYAHISGGTKRTKGAERIKANFSRTVKH